jgi:hypothetical protein
VRDQDRVVVRVERPLAAQEVEQVRHLLEVRRDVRAVAVEVRVVELEVDDVPDAAVAVAERALAGGRIVAVRERRSGERERQGGRAGERDERAVHGSSRWSGARPAGPGRAEDNRGARARWQTTRERHPLRCGVGHRAPLAARSPPPAAQPPGTSSLETSVA